MKRIVIAAAAAALCLCSSRGAQACGAGGSSNSNTNGMVALLTVTAAVLAVGTDVGFTAHDLFADKSSVNYGAGEALLTAPQIAIFGYAFVEAARGPELNRSSSMVGAGLGMLWMAGLTAHGIYAAVKGEPSPPVVMPWDQQPHSEAATPTPPRHPAPAPSPQFALAPLIGPVFADPLAVAMQDPLGKKTQQQNFGAQALLRF